MTPGGQPRLAFAALLLLTAGGCKPASLSSLAKDAGGLLDEPTATATSSISVPCCRPRPPKGSISLELARELAQRLIIVDGHVDLPHRLFGSKDAAGKLTEDVRSRTQTGDFDAVRAKEGGLDAPFMSIYVPATYQDSGGAKAHADALIDLVFGLAGSAPQLFALARSPDEIRANSRANKISLPLGIENGAAIERDLANLEHFAKRGVRYMTLTHSKDNAICDSSYDETGTWKGLSPFGRQVVAEMNRLGIMIDLSHVSDEAFYQALELSRAPVILSHSSARHFVPGFERNAGDGMITALAKKGGVVMVNFGSSFLTKEANAYYDEKWAAMKSFAKTQGLTPGHPKLKEESLRYAAAHPPVRATIEDVVEHIDHIVKLVGVDHVGFGSDFDGVGDGVPVGLEDASKYPALIQLLLEHAYTPDEIEKLCSGNVFRVWRAVEAVAASAGAR